MRSLEYQRLMKSRKWKRIRDEYIKAHPLCERCEAEGRTRPVEEVHHIIPVAYIRDPERMRALAYDKTNLQSLCSDCHHAVHEEMMTKKKEAAREKDARQAESFVKRFCGTPTRG